LRHDGTLYEYAASLKPTVQVPIAISAELTLLPLGRPIADAYLTTPVFIVVALNSCCLYGVSVWRHLLVILTL
jgi:hypothetical protein